MTEKNDNVEVKTADKVFDILKLIREREGARVSEVASELDIASSTASRHLTTLHTKKYLVKEGDEYQLGLRFLDFGECARRRKEAYVMAGSKVEELATETKERAQFIVEEHGEGIYIHRELGEHAVQTDPGIGRTIPLHASASGKAILANLPADRVDSIVDEGLSSMTENTITDPQELREELQRIHEVGYSDNDQEYIEGLRAVGVPIKDQNGLVIGAFSVSGPTRRMRGERFENDIPNLLMGMAEELELNLAYG